MLNGLKALFSSGLIFQPMVLCGVVGGFLLSIHLDWEDFFPMFGNVEFYLMMTAVAGLYTLFFNRTYKEHSLGFDYPAMGGKFLGNFLQLALACVLTFIFFEVLFF